MLLAKHVLYAVLLVGFARANAVGQAEDACREVAGPQPKVYTLDVPLACPRAVDVDEYGNIYVLDHGRQALMQFSSSGELEYLWPDGFDYGYQPSGRLSISYAPDAGIFMAPFYTHLPELRVINPQTRESRVLSFSEAWWATGIAALPTGDFYMIKYDGGRIGSIHAYRADGQRKLWWQTPRLCSIAVAPNGLVYARARDSGTILVYSSEGKLERVIDLSEDVRHPIGNGSLAIDSNGDIYVSGKSGRSKRIVRLNAEGEVVAGWHISHSCQSRRGYDGCLIAVRNGLVYTISCSSCGEIQTFTPAGQCIARYVSPKRTPTMPRSVAVHQDGSYAVEQDVLGNLLLFDARGEASGSMARDSRFCSVCVGPHGGYYAANVSGIYRFDAEGRKVATVCEVRIPDSPTKLDEDQYPHTVEQVALDPTTGNVWGVASGRRGPIISVYGPNEKLVTRLPELSELFAGGFVRGIAVDPQGFFYLPDVRNHQIAKFSSEGTLISRLGKQGNGLGELSHPANLLVDQKGNLYVADEGNSRIHVFDSGGTPLGWWGRHGHGDGELDRPRGLAFGADETLWIADTFNDRIVRIPQERFWRELRTRPEPAPVAEAPVAAPSPGRVTVTGIVTAGTDDFDDCIYVESPDRAWGVEVTVPSGIQVRRGDHCRLAGVLETGAKGTRHLAAESVEHLAANVPIPAPLGMANLYVGDGYRWEGQVMGLSNLALLVRTWGRVVSVHPASGHFIINDSSFADSSNGLAVSTQGLRPPIETLPRVGQYVGVTGISVTLPGTDHVRIPGIRVRGEADVEVFEER